MNQRGARLPRRHFILLLALTPLVFAGCERKSPTSPTGSAATRPDRKHPTVASLSPAATDILVAIGASDHLVAVSNYDLGKPAVESLRGAGDYLTVDWERLADVNPDLLVVQVLESKAPAGFKQKAAELGMQPVYIHIDRLADISASTKTLGEVVKEPEKADAAERAMRARLVAVADSVKRRPKVPTLVITDEVGAGAAGGGTFLDEILTIAGGSNVAASEGSGYPGVDREKIIALKPQVVLHLLPEKPQRIVDEAKRFWESLPDVPAVKSGRVHFLTDASVMQPGLGVGQIAELFADRIHPDRHTKPETRPRKPSP